MDVRIVAVAKTIKDKALASARDGLSVGTHQIDCAVRIKGSLKVGEDGQTDVRGTVNYKAAFATACGLLSDLIEAQNEDMPETAHIDTMVSLIGMILKQEETAEKLGQGLAPVIAEIEKRLTRVTGTTPKNGAVTTKLAYEFMPVPEKVLSA